MTVEDKQTLEENVKMRLTLEPSRLHWGHDDLSEDGSDAAEYVWLPIGSKNEGEYFGEVALVPGTWVIETQNQEVGLEVTVTL